MRSLMNIVQFLCEFGSSASAVNVDISKDGKTAVCEITATLNSFKAIEYLNAGREFGYTIQSNGKSILFIKGREAGLFYDKEKHKLEDVLAYDFFKNVKTTKIKYRNMHE